MMLKRTFLRQSPIGSLQSLLQTQLSISKAQAVCPTFTQRRPFSSPPFLRAKKNKRDEKQQGSPIGKTGISAEAFDTTALESACLELVNRLQKDVVSVKQGRQNPSILNNIKIPSENTTLGKLANVAQKNPRTYVVIVYDPAHVKLISAAIASSGQNLNPQPMLNNPQQLTINIPKDSSDSKAEKLKQLGAKAEQTRSGIRHLRADALKSIKSSGNSDDVQKREEKDVGSIIEKVTKDLNKVVDNFKKDL